MGGSNGNNDIVAEERSNANLHMAHVIQAWLKEKYELPIGFRLSRVVGGEVAEAEGIPMVFSPAFSVPRDRLSEISLPTSANLEASTLQSLLDTVCGRHDIRMREQSFHVTVRVGYGLTPVKYNGNGGAPSAQFIPMARTYGGEEPTNTSSQNYWDKRGLYICCMAPGNCIQNLYHGGSEFEWAKSIGAENRALQAVQLSNATQTTDEENIAIVRGSQILVVLVRFRIKQESASTGLEIAMPRNDVFSYGGGGMPAVHRAVITGGEGVEDNTRRAKVRGDRYIESVQIFSLGVGTLDVEEAQINNQGEMVRNIVGDMWSECDRLTRNFLSRHARVITLAEPLPAESIEPMSRKKNKPYDLSAIDESSSQRVNQLFTKKIRSQILELGNYLQIEPRLISEMEKFVNGKISEAEYKNVPQDLLIQLCTQTSMLPTKQAEISRFKLIEEVMQNNPHLDPFAPGGDGESAWSRASKLLYPAARRDIVGYFEEVRPQRQQLPSSGGMFASTNKKNEGKTLLVAFVESAINGLRAIIGKGDEVYPGSVFMDPLEDLIDTLKDTVSAARVSKVFNCFLSGVVACNPDDEKCIKLLKCMELYCLGFGLDCKVKDKNNMSAFDYAQKITDPRRRETVLKILNESFSPEKEFSGLGSERLSSVRPVSWESSLRREY